MSSQPMSPNASSLPWRIEHVITGLQTGGAEMMLLKLLSLHGPEWDPVVVSLSDEGTIGSRIAELGIRVWPLRMKRIGLNTGASLALIRVTRQFQPHVIQGWMYHGNVMASLGGCMQARAPILWNIRQTIYDLTRERPATAFMIRLGAFLSSLPAAIIYNSRTSARQHEELGYRSTKTIVIPNGFDCDSFKPDSLAKNEIRQELGLKAHHVLIGLIGRYHPMKDHLGFLRAAGKVARLHPGARFLLVGRDVNVAQPDLLKAIKEEGLKSKAFLLGERSDTRRINAALDIACSSSAWGEGFSNTIGEAMACGVPCVVTDVGDSAFLVHNTGRVVSAGNPEELASAIDALISIGQEQRSYLGEAARDRIKSEFSLSSIAKQYYDLYRQHVESKR